MAHAQYDLEKIDLPISSEECHQKEHGTTITLHGLNQNLHFPNAERLKEILIRDNGRETDFEIIVNGECIGVLDLKGKAYEEEITLANGKKTLLKFTITDKRIKQPGIAVRVNNKIIGKPINFFTHDELVPKKLQDRVYGELICDELEDDVTSDFGAIIENSKLFQEVSKAAKSNLKGAIQEVFTTDMQFARARYQKRINKELEKLPEHRRAFAEKQIARVLERFYGESEEKSTQ